MAWLFWQPLQRTAHFMFRQRGSWIWNYIDAQISTKHDILSIIYVFSGRSLSSFKAHDLKKKPTTTKPGATIQTLVSQDFLIYYWLPLIAVRQLQSCLDNRAKQASLWDHSRLLHLCFVSTNKRPLSFGKQNLQTPVVLAPLQLSK